MRSNYWFSAYPVICNPNDLDNQSGSLTERLLFNHRPVVLVLCLIASLLLGFQATKLRLNASFEKTIPIEHPYVVNFLRHQEDLKGLNNFILIAVETTGTIFDAGYLEMLRRVSDEIFLLPGVDRPYMKSLWTPSVRWIGVTEEGLDGGPVIPDTYNGSMSSIEQVRLNLEHSGEIGQLVAANYKSTIIFVPLLDWNSETGKALDYGQFSRAVEQVRAKYQTQEIKIRVTGFAKVVGDLIEGLQALSLFFAIAILIAATILYLYTRCLRSTLLVVFCSLLAVLWLLGLLPTLGYALDPYSILVPFLVFAIGMSHGAQKMNGIMQDIGRGTHRWVAARYTFRRLFLAGLTALLADAAGFAVLMIIPIRAIQDLAVTASIGVAGLIFTNLILLPILLSYFGVSEPAASRSIKTELSEADGGAHVKRLLRYFVMLLMQRKTATIVIATAGVLGAVGFAISMHLKVGDLDPGAPELHPDSRYNRDNAFIAANYATSSDILVIMVQTPASQCSAYNTLVQVDALEWELLQLPEVESTHSFSGLSKRWAVGMSEGNLKWYEIPRTRDMINAVAARAPPGLFNQNCDLLSLYVYLQDHKADTLNRVFHQVETFAAKHNTHDIQFLLGAGNAGLEGATNIVVKHANLQMLELVYAVVIALCFIAFRSWQAVICAMVPLVLTSILCEALMVLLNIGVKVATLPVIALGVGIGVDYALYVLTVMLAGVRQGMPLTEAYYRSLLFTGKVVVLTGLTLAISIATWGFSPIKFQADMGILLAFMFIWNMLGALILLPALTHFLIRSRLSHPTWNQRFLL